MRCVSFFTVLQGNGDWRVTYSSSNVCALRGAMVDISCTYEYPDNVQYRPNTDTTLWFTEGDNLQPVDLKHDAEYTGRVESSCGEVSCTGSRCHGTCSLRINDLRQSDSAVYKFRFTTNQPGGEYTGDPGVTLSVTDLQVKVSCLYPTNPTWTQLECHSMCGPAGDPRYTWFRNGQNVGQEVKSRGHFLSEGNYSCAVEGYEQLGSPLVWLQGNGDWTVAYSSSNVCALRGATVDINCTYEYPDNVQYRPNTDTTLWFTKGDKYQPVDLKNDTDYTGRVETSCGEVSCTGSRCYGTCTLRIKDLRQSDSAVYKFRFTTNLPGGEYTGDPGVTLSLTDLQVKVSFPDPTDPTRAELECHSMCGLAGDTPYIWFRNGQNVGQGVNYLAYIQSGDSFLCAVEGYERLRSPSVYAPKTPSVTVSPSGEIKEGSSVTLSCSSDANPAATYTWFRVNTGRSSRKLNQGPQLVFGRILSSNSGQYRCEATNKLGKKSVTKSIDVKYAPKTPSVTVSPSGEIEEGSSVTLSCSSDANPAANYTWFKVDTGRSSRKKYQGPQLVFNYILSSVSGQYRCEAQNTIGKRYVTKSIDVKYAPKTPSVTVSPSGEIEEGSSVTLSCSSDANPAANYTWFKDITDRYSRHMNQGPQFIISYIWSFDSGQYRCDATNKLGKKSVTKSIDVKYAPKTPSVTVSPSGEVEEGSSVTLSCSSDANPAAEYTWFKEHEDSVKASGQNYSITNITSEHGGNYYCQAHNAIGHHNSTFLIIKVTSSSSSSSHPAMVAVTTIVVLLATILLLVFLWMRRKRAASKACGQGGRPDTVEEPLPVSVYENVSALINRLAPAAQREPIEEQDEPHYASINTSRSENQEVPRCWIGSNVQSDQADAVFYSVVNIKRLNAVAGQSDQTEAAETSELYSTVQKHPRY
ncbi:unnamed protein product [Boreogadus saida]